MSAVEQVESLPNKLSENCSPEDVQYQPYALDKLRHGMKDANKQGILWPAGEPAES